MVGLLIIGGVALVVLLMLGRPVQPLTDPALQARRDLAARVQDETDREQDRRDRDDDVNENRGDDH